MIQRAWYRFCRLLMLLVFVVVYRIRFFGHEHVPCTGGGLVLSNHQSHLDPVIVGIASPRPVNPLARQSLFTFAPFRWLILSLGAIPIDRDGFGLRGIKDTLKRLKQGKLVLIFPEGTRTADGELKPFKAGFTTLATRSRLPLLPVAIAGAYESWPRKRKLPRPGTIVVQFGAPIEAADYAELSDEALLALVQERVAECFAQAKQRRQSLTGSR